MRQAALPVRCLRWAVPFPKLLLLDLHRSRTLT